MSASTFRADELKFHPTDAPQQKLPLEELIFGKHFTDHMLKIEWTAAGGWGAPTVVKMEAQAFHPASQVLHYGISCFEGMKAYRAVDGSIRMFRPEMNCARFNRSCQSLGLPAFDETEMRKVLEKYVDIEKDWVPDGEGYSLYLRPVAMATTPFLGLAVCQHATMYAFASPSGGYFSGALRLFVDEKNVRAWHGGSGHVKLAGNYGHTIKYMTEAREKHNAGQVLYTIPTERGCAISECGAMNFFVAFALPDGKVELATPPLDGTILPGVTRDTICALGREMENFVVSEREVLVDEIWAAAKEGRLLDAFCAGTAVVVQAPTVICRDGHDDIPLTYAEDVEPVHMLMKRTMLDIQYGRVPRPDWSPVVAPSQ